MCGRFSLRASPDDLVEHFSLVERPPWEPRYNVAPEQPVLTVRKGRRGRRAGLMRWGLIPPGMRTPDPGRRLINARRETVARRPAFREAFAHSRCLVPADGFYEWRADGRLRRPFFFTVGDDTIFAFAGIWTRWTTPEGHRIGTVSILTTDANPLVRPIHDRMPVILDPGGYATWLDPAADRPTLLDLTDPFPPDRMSSREVSRAVNRADHEGPDCLAPPDPPVERDLFDPA